MGSNAFYYCYSLRTVVLPSSLKSIRENAFYEYSRNETPDGEKLSVYNYALDPQSIGDYAFSQYDTIHVTRGYRDVYVNNEQWGKYTIVDDIEPIAVGDANGDGTINGADFTAIANYLLGIPNANFVESAADVNGDGIINGADFTAVANLLLYGNIRGEQQ